MLTFNISWNAAIQSSHCRILISRRFMWIVWNRFVQMKWNLNATSYIIITSLFFCGNFTLPLLLFLYFEKNKYLVSWYLTVPKNRQLWLAFYQEIMPFFISLLETFCMLRLILLIIASSGFFFLKYMFCRRNNCSPYGRRVENLSSSLHLKSLYSGQNILFVESRHHTYCIRFF